MDTVCPKAYNLTTLQTEALGGSEATLVRIAQALALKEDYAVMVVQHNRKEEALNEGVMYKPFGSSKEFNPTHIVVQRNVAALKQVREQYPHAKLYLWCHDVVGGDVWTKFAQSLVNTQTLPIFVSQWHQTQFYEFLRSIQFVGSVPSKVLYNPIDNDLKPNGTDYDPNKYVFFSSPHKGLARVLEIFERFKDFPELKDSKLYIANPGYFPNDTTQAPWLINLGALPHSAVINHVRSAQAVLHLNNVFPETFGIVHAECNAVGTPFLNAAWAATPELADHPEELIDVSDNKKVIDRLIKWKTKGRPAVRGNPNFRMYKVIREWTDFLGVS